MVAEAQRHEAEDTKRREEIERRNKLDTLCYTLEKTLAENRDKLADADVASLNALIAEGRRAIEQQDDALVAAALEKVEKEAHRVARVMYEKTGAQPPGAPAPPSGAREAEGKEGVIDAEFEETGT